MSRKILVISNQNNTKKMIESNATTRGELEQELNALGINTSEMSFFEGFSRTDLVDANSQLPAKVMYKGRETTDLIITLTPNSIKKVANGADYSRDEAYRIIRDNHLENDIWNEFDRPYQMISTKALNGFIESWFEDNETEDDFDNEKKTCSCCEMTNEQFLVNCLKNIKSMIEDALKRVNPTIEDLRNLNLDELVKEFGK